MLIVSLLSLLLERSHYQHTSHSYRIFLYQLNHKSKSNTVGLFLRRFLTFIKIVLIKRYEQMCPLLCLCGYLFFICNKTHTNWITLLSLLSIIPMFIHQIAYEWPEYDQHCCVSWREWHLLIVKQQLSSDIIIPLKCLLQYYLDNFFWRFEILDSY